eukprot:1813100-Rhodomonas_salina.3
MHSAAVPARLARIRTGSDACVSNSCFCVGAGGGGERRVAGRIRAAAVSVIHVGAPEDRRRQGQSCTG